VQVVVNFVTAVCNADSDHCFRARAAYIRVCLKEKWQGNLIFGQQTTNHLISLEKLAAK